MFGPAKDVYLFSPMDKEKNNYLGLAQLLITQQFSL